MREFEGKIIWEPPIGEAFFVSFAIDRKTYRLEVECIFRDKATESYRAKYQRHSFIIGCNWPVFRNRGLKHRMPTWKLIEGKLTYRSSFKVIVEAIEQYITKHHA